MTFYKRISNFYRTKVLVNLIMHPHGSFLSRKISNLGTVDDGRGERYAIVEICAQKVGKR